MFDALIAEVSAERGIDIVAPSLPGHGLSPWGTDLSTFDDVVDAIAATLPPRSVVVGYSLGGRLALSLAARHPGRCASVVTIGADLGIVNERERRTRRSWDRSLAAIATARGMEALVDAWEKLPIFASQKTLPAPVQERQREARLGHRPEAVAWSLETLGTGSMPPLQASLGRARVPLVLTAGALDEKFSAIATRAASRIPHARALIIDGAGHNVVIEAPRAVATAILTHLADVGTPGSRSEPESIRGTP